MTINDDDKAVAAVATPASNSKRNYKKRGVMKTDSTCYENGQTCYEHGHTVHKSTNRPFKLLLKL